MKNIKNLSATEYNSPMKPWSFAMQVKARVDREAEATHAYDPVPCLPRFIKTEIVKKSPGWTNFFMQLMP